MIELNPFDQRSGMVSLCCLLLREAKQDNEMEKLQFFLNVWLLFTVQDD